MHYYKFNIADWALHTSHLSLVEESIYFRLINHYYDTESPIPLETQSVVRRLRMGDHSDSVQYILDEFFTKTEKGYEHKRCEEMIKEYRKTVYKNRKNAAKGGRPKKDKTSSETQSVSSGIPEVSERKPEGIPNQEPLTNNHKPLTTIDGEKSKKRFVPPTFEEASLYFFDRTQDKGWSLTESQRFIDFYESKGWYVGKNKMKDWKSAIRNWLSRNNPQPSMFGSQPTGQQLNKQQVRSNLRDITNTEW